MALARQHILLETNIHVTYPAPAGAKCLTVTLRRTCVRDRASLAYLPRVSKKFEIISSEFFHSTRNPFSLLRHLSTTLPRVEIQITNRNACVPSSTR